MSGPVFGFSVCDFISAVYAGCEADMIKSSGNETVEAAIEMPKMRPELTKLPALSVSWRD